MKEFTETRGLQWLDFVPICLILGLNEWNYLNADDDVDTGLF